MRPILLCAVLAGCAANSDGPEDTDTDATARAASCDGGDTRTLIVRHFDFARAEGGVSAGFDLDGHATFQGDAQGCGVGDLVGPDGTEGIDNAFSRLVPILDLTEAASAADVINDAVRSGDVLVLARVTGIDDPVNDDCVTVEILQGQGAPILDATREVVPNQTFAVREGAPRVVVPDAVLRDGSVEARPFDLSLPLSILNANLNIVIESAAVRFDLAPDGTFDAVLAGGVDVEDLLEQVTSQGVAAEVLDLVRPVLASTTDLAPDANGVCTRLSTTLQVAGVDAFVVE